MNKVLRLLGVLRPSPPLVLLTVGSLFAGRSGLAESATSLQLVAPIGGASVLLEGGRVVCGTEGEVSGWVIDRTRHRIRPPTAVRGFPVTLKVARDLAACAQSTESVVLLSPTGWPEIEARSLTLNVDAGRLDVTGRNLRGAGLVWRVGSRTGGDICHEPKELGGGMMQCALSVDRDLPADATRIALNFLPAGVRLDVPSSLYDSRGSQIDLAHINLRPSRIVVMQLLQADSALDADSGLARLEVRHAEAVGSVNCVDASCLLDGNAIVVRAEHGTDEHLEIRALLRPHVFYQGETGLETRPILRVPLQRCPLQIASAPPLRGIAGQRVIVRVGGRCREDASLRFFSSGAPARLVSRRTEGNELYAVVHMENLPGDEVTLSLQRGSTIMGVVRARTRALQSARARVELPNFGPIDFIPSNREAQVVLPPTAEGGALVPLPVEGVYTVRLDERGVYHVRGIEGTNGWIGLRLAYRDHTLPASLAEVNLAEVTDSVDRAIHQASIPISLGANTMTQEPLIELICGNDAKNEKNIKPAHVTNIAFGERDTCRLLMHRERLDPENGEQVLRVTVAVSTLDGLVRPEAAFDQRLILRPGSQPRMLYVNGAIARYDRITVRVSLMTDDLRYAVTPDDKLTLPSTQYSLVMGNDHLRLYGTTALPTGLFRVADKGHSGLYGLNLGILFRLVALTRDGHQAPLGLELGAVLAGITGDTAPSPGGNMVVVGGLSIGVPIANVSRATQASISLHAWAEYEVTRAFRGRTAGQPWGFIFGPSLSLGDVGTSF